jgi:hypothetical protein
MTGTHTTTAETIDVCGTQQVAACLPADWEGEQVTVVRGAAPEGLTPAGDGTYYGPLSAVPEDWSWTDHTEATAQVKAYNARGRHAGRIVMAWPGPAPQSVGPVQTIVDVLNDEASEGVGPLAIAETIRDRLRSAGLLVEDDQ